MDKTTYFYPNKTLNLGGRIMDLSTPKVMGILNLTPDSFYDGGKFNSLTEALKQVEKMIAEGADFIDIGGMSSRPGAAIIDTNEEINRILPVLQSIVKEFPESAISVDTIHSDVARIAIENGAAMINDISAGKFDSGLTETIAKYHVPYVVMHMQGSPADMQVEPHYENVTREVFEFLIQKAASCRSAGVRDIIIDPGFGFGKNVEHNYELIENFELFKQSGFPVMVGISRKSLICKLLKVNPEQALNGTTALHAVLAMKGADIFRVHDVHAVVEVLKITGKLNAL